MSRGWRFFGALLSSALTLTSASRASALFPERYIACNDDTRRQYRAEWVEAAAPELTPLPRRRAPSPLEVAPLIVADVASASPTPRGHKDPARFEEPPPPMLEASNDYRCLGIPRGKAGLLRVVGAPPGTRFLNHPYPESWIEDNVNAAGAFALEGARPSLKRMLERKVPASLEPYVKLQRLRLRSRAANALADLGDTASAPGVLEFLREREGSDYPGFWEDTLGALPRLDPTLAHDYAVEALERIGATSSHDTGEANRLRDLLPLLSRRDARTRAALEKVHSEVDAKGTGSGHASCLVFAARMRAGDATLRGELQKELSVDLRTNRSTVCFSEAIAAAFPGEDPDEVTTLLFRHRYRELLRLVATISRREKEGSKDARNDKARTAIRAWLKERADDPDIVKDRTDRRYNPEDRARHLALGAALGDAASAKELAALIADPADAGIAPWIGAAIALDLDLAGAADQAAKRLLIARQQHTERHSAETWPERGNLTVTEHVAVIDRLAARGDARFALGLLDRQIFARQASVHHVARLRSSAVCKVVTEAAASAEEKSIQDAFWALSVLGDGCKASFEKLWQDKAQPPEVRGMALEALAMLRHTPIAVEVERKDVPKDTIRPARQRARIIYRSPE